MRLLPWRMWHMREVTAMHVFSLTQEQEWDPRRHVEKILGKIAGGDVTVACWEPGQISPIHCHPGADEIYHIVQGEGLFSDGRTERRLGRGDTVVFPAGEVHQVQAVTRMVLYRVQAGADRHPESLQHWPAAGVRP